jgi:hypothetical protein
LALSLKNLGRPLGVAPTGLRKQALNYATLCELCELRAWSVVLFVLPRFISAFSANSAVNLAQPLPSFVTFVCHPVFFSAFNLLFYFSTVLLL